MNPYSFFLLKFAYVLGKHSKEVKTFIFSTMLVEITDLLRTRRMSDALRMLSQMTIGWSGGTRIGGSLQDFNRRHAPALLSRNTLFIILSDGWDTGPPEELAAEIRKIKNRIMKLIWLNPLLGLEDYQAGDTRDQRGTAFHRCLRAGAQLAKSAGSRGSSEAGEMIR